MLSLLYVYLHTPEILLSLVHILSNSHFFSMSFVECAGSKYQRYDELTNSNYGSNVNNEASLGRYIPSHTMIS